MTQTQADISNDNILPADTHMAVQQMIKLSSDLVDVAENETQKLVQNDMLGFAMLQDDKEKLVGHYVQASQEFQTRLEEFRGTDENLLNRLDTLQKTLGERTKSNNVIVKRLNEKSEKNTMDSLLAVQEIAQTVHKRFPQGHGDDEVAQKSQANS